jgi:hypothetical protein
MDDPDLNDTLPAGESSAIDWQFLALTALAPCNYENYTFKKKQNLSGPEFHPDSGALRVGVPPSTQHKPFESG